MTWFRKPERKLQAADRRDLPADVFEKCPGCGEILYKERLAQNAQVCPECGTHFRISADDYVRLLTDEGSFTPRDEDLRSDDPLAFTDLKPYRKRLDAAERKAVHGDAVLSGSGTLEGIPLELAVMDFAFIGGSMGSVVGEKIARAGRRALVGRRPLVVVSASGGARMQEGILSLMQMAKTSAVLAQLHDAGLPYISVLTDPTTGGVTASFAMLGDAIVAEPGALIGFAGPRVIEQTIKQELPEGFQRSEFLLRHGMVDAIVDRRQLKATLARLLGHMMALPAPVPATGDDEQGGEPGGNGGAPAADVAASAARPEESPGGA
ncbi:MAG TPA: acetyl-CoA carboxylase, carboxyltransferase subunit beta [Longimicrobiales bacterium]|nr:acetyl-CoA carboxylase, carboxyltransferase subunit beta [Longimicrobiales bacterium]